RRLPTASPAMNTVRTALTEKVVLPITIVKSRVHTTSYTSPQPPDMKKRTRKSEDRLAVPFMNAQNICILFTGSKSLHCGGKMGRGGRKLVQVGGEERTTLKSTRPILRRAHGIFQFRANSFCAGVHRNGLLVFLHFVQETGEMLQSQSNVGSFRSK